MGRVVVAVVVSAARGSENPVETDRGPDDRGRTGKADIEARPGAPAGQSVSGRIGFTMRSLHRRRGQNYDYRLMKWICRRL